MGRGGAALRPDSPPPKNRPRVPCPSWQQRVFLVMTHCQEATQSSNLPRYLPSKFEIQARHDPSKFRSNPIKLANISDTLSEGVD